MSNRNFYVEMEERKERQMFWAGTITTLAILGCCGAGIILCHLGKVLGQPYFPALNLAGTIVLLVIPGILAVITALYQNLYRTGWRQHLQQAAEKLFIYIFVAGSVAYHYSSRDGYVYGLTVFVLVDVFLAITALAFYVNRCWYHLLLATGHPD